MQAHPTAAAFTGWITTLAREHTTRLAGVARREGLDPTDALDAVQEGFHSFLLLPQARALADEPEDAAKLMTVLVRNVARNMRRRHFRALPHDPVEDVALADDSSLVDELVARAEEHVALLGCVTRLGQVQRSVVTLRMLQEASSKEAAEQLGLSANHVAVLLLRAKRSLERCLAA